MSDLKPCPFCGSDAEHWFSTRNGLNLTNLGGAILHGEKCDHHIIKCMKCGVRTKIYATKKNCFNAWNRRYPNENPETRQDWEMEVCVP